MRQISTIIREPLVQFILIGTLLYGFYLWLSPNINTRNQQNIIINKAVLTNIINIKSKRSLNSQELDAIIDSLDKRKLDELTAEYIRQEALYREALALGLDNNDFVIKRRLVQKLLFLLEDLSKMNIKVSNKALTAYYEKHKQEYQSKPTVTFTHVYLNTDIHGQETLAQAKKLLHTLNSKNVDANNARNYGDHFPLMRTYAELSPNALMLQFGRDFTAQTFKLHKSDDWQGPVKSGYGYHLVKILKTTDAKTPGFDEVKHKLKQRFIYDKQLERNNKITHNIIRKYNIINQLDSADALKN